MNETDEEFDNFLYKVNEIGGIIKKLASTDEHLQEIGNLEAAKYLGETTSINDEDKSMIKITSNRTVVNRKALLLDDINGNAKNNNEMSQEAFMREMSRDADQRYHNKLIRKEKMETFRKQAMLAFRRGDYPKALTLYNKAIEQIKDSALLYQNRTLTCINLKLYDRAISDAQTALKLNENSLKTWLLLAKAHYLDENRIEFENAVREACERNPDDKQFVSDYVSTLTKNEA